MLSNECPASWPDTFTERGRAPRPWALWETGGRRRVILLSAQTSLAASLIAATHGRRYLEGGGVRVVGGWKARNIQEAAEVIPTLDQQRGDVIGTRVQERLWALVLHRRRSPSSHRDSQLWQRRAKSPHKISCFLTTNWAEDPQSTRQKLSVSHQRQLHRLHTRTGVSMEIGRSSSRCRGSEEIA